MYRVAGGNVNPPVKLIVNGPPSFLFLRPFQRSTTERQMSNIVFDTYVEITDPDIRVDHQESDRRVVARIGPPRSNNPTTNLTLFFKDPESVIAFAEALKVGGMRLKVQCERSPHLPRG
jgi:hypothetical protein